MAVETSPQIPESVRHAAEADLRIIEVDNLREVQANYQQFAQTVKPILKRGAAKLLEYGIFPEQEVTSGDTIQAIDVTSITENSLKRVVIDANGTMFLCDVEATREDYGYVIDWDTKKEATDDDYVDFSLPSLHDIANMLRVGIGMKTQGNPIPFHLRW